MSCGKFQRHRLSPRPPASHRSMWLRSRTRPAQSLCRPPGRCRSRSCWALLRPRCFCFAASATACVRVRALMARGARTCPQGRARWSRLIASRIPRNNARAATRRPPSLLLPPHAARLHAQPDRRGACRAGGAGARAPRLGRRAARGRGSQRRHAAAAATRGLPARPRAGGRSGRGIRSGCRHAACQLDVPLFGAACGRRCDWKCVIIASR